MIGINLCSTIQLSEWRYTRLQSEPSYWLCFISWKWVILLIAKLDSFAFFSRFLFQVLCCKFAKNNIPMFHILSDNSINFSFLTRLKWSGWQGRIPSSIIWLLYTYGASDLIWWQVAWYWHFDIFDISWLWQVLYRTLWIQDQIWKSQILDIIFSPLLYHLSQIFTKLHI